MWNKNKGATFVRNDNYDPKTDSTDIRKALPDKIDFHDRPDPGDDLRPADRGQR